MTVEDTPDYGTAPARNVQDEVEGDTMPALPTVPPHAAHLDPNSMEEVPSATALTLRAVCAVCNNEIGLTMPEGVDIDAAYAPLAPWLHLADEGQVTTLGLLPGGMSTLATYLREPTPRLLVVDEAQPLQANIFEVAAVMFTPRPSSTDPNAVNVVQQSFTVAASTREAAEDIVLEQNPGWSIVRDSVLSGDAVPVVPTGLPYPVIPPPAQTYEEPNMVSVSDDDTEHPREDPTATTAEESNRWN